MGSWQVSSYCNTDHQTGNCIAVKGDPGSERVFVKDDELNDLPLVTTRSSFKAWVLGAKNGEFDHLT